MPPIRSVVSEDAIRELHRQIDLIPGDEGFWKGGRSYHRLGEWLLVRVGMTEAETIMLLNDLFWDAAAEFAN